METIERSSDRTHTHTYASKKLVSSIRGGGAPARIMRLNIASAHTATVRCVRAAAFYFVWPLLLGAPIDGPAAQDRPPTTPPAGAAAVPLVRVRVHRTVTQAAHCLRFARQARARAIALWECAHLRVRGDSVRLCQ